MLSDTHRKTYLVPACLSTKKSSMHVQYRAWEHIGAIVDHKASTFNNFFDDSNAIINCT